MLRPVHTCIKLQAFTTKNINACLNYPEFMILNIKSFQSHEANMQQQFMQMMHHIIQIDVTHIQRWIAN